MESIANKILERHKIFRDTVNRNDQSKKKKKKPCIILLEGK